MKLWTMVPEQAWEALNDRGVLRATQRHIDPDYMQAYEWMSYQMIVRLGLTDMATQFPIWAWYQYHDVLNKRPDLLSTTHLTHGEVGYRVEFECEDDRVLLSDFDTWHHVLNYYYLPQSDRDHDAFLKRYGPDADSAYSWDRRPAQTEVAQAIEASWVRIFDLDWHVPGINFPSDSKVIQGCIEQLEIGQVTEVDRFVAC